MYIYIDKTNCEMDLKSMNCFLRTRGWSLHSKQPTSNALVEYKGNRQKSSIVLISAFGCAARCRKGSETKDKRRAHKGTGNQRRSWRSQTTKMTSQKETRWIRWIPPRFRCATLDRSYQTISRLCPLIRSSYDLKPSDLTVVGPTKLCDHSATQRPLIRPSCGPNLSDQTIVKPKILYDFSATNAPSDQTIPEYTL